MSGVCSTPNEEVNVCNVQVKAHQQIQLASPSRGAARLQHPLQDPQNHGNYESLLVNQPSLRIQADADL